MSIRFARGQQVVWRSKHQGQVGYVIPFTGIEDSDRTIVLVQHDGCTCMKRTGRRGGPGGRQMLPNGWDGGHEALHWAPGHDTVRVHVPGTSHAVIRAWHRGAQRFEGWYVNLELPWTRTRIGFDSCDLVLDAVVSDDLMHATLKDEDELAWALEAGTISGSEAELARAEADRVIETLRDGSGLFAADWDQWRPEAGWPVAEIPPDWRSVP